MKRRSFAAGSAAFTLISIAGCAVNTPPSSTKDRPKTSEAASLKPRESYAGRLSFVVDPEMSSSAAQQSFSGSFELRGNAQIGELDLLTPLGQIAMQLRWQPDIAVILRGNQRQIFASADDLIKQATGASLSVAQLFDWLEGKSTSVGAGDWQVDLANHANGRIIARRSLPTPAVLRIALEMP